jgi:dipeptidyl aminopeptidase/acylaminoacyl peptidase
MRPRHWILGRVLVAGLLAAGAAAQETAQRQIGQMVLEGVPEWDDALRERMLQYLAVRPTALASVSDDGRCVLILTRFGDTNQLHLVTAPLGMRRQLTFFDEPITGAQFVPGSGGERIVFRRDVGGNERYQYYALDLARGSSRLLTDGKARNESLVISRSGRRMAYAGTARNGKDFDIYLKDLASDEPGRLLCELEGSWGGSEFDPDEARLLVVNYISERETHWHVLDVRSGRMEPVTPPSPPFYYGGGAWDAEGRAAYFFSDRDGEFRKLYRLDFEYGEWKCLTPDIDWDVEEVAADPAGGGIAFVVNEDGLSRLYFADSTGANRRMIRDVPAGVIGGLRFAAGGGVLGFTLDSGRAPADAYTLTFPEGRVTRWTESEVGGLNPAQFVEAELIRYPTFDEVNGRRREIPAFVFRGRGEGRRPVVIYPHGGPESQYVPTFSSTFQYWAVELGITVICPNVRGSTGYGRTFHQLDNGVKREDSVRDIGALLDWIGQQPDLDSQRVGIYGGSYGGYMVLASLVNYPGRIRAGIDVVGIADFITFLTNTEEYRRDLRRAEYGDERDPEVRKVLESISPLRNAQRIEAALFVLHGQNDPRVPVSEAQQIVSKMRELNRPVWFANALNEGHGFRKKPNRDLATILYALFWEKHLLN